MAPLRGCYGPPQGGSGPPQGGYGPFLGGPKKWKVGELFCEIFGLTSIHMLCFASNYLRLQLFLSIVISEAPNTEN